MNDFGNDSVWTPEDRAILEARGQEPVIYFPPPSAAQIRALSPPREIPADRCQARSYRDEQCVQKRGHGPHHLVEREPPPGVYELTYVWSE